MKIKTIVSLLFASMLLVSVSCKKPDLLIPNCDLSNPTYDSDIKTIIDSYCTGGICHDAGSKRGDFTNYATMFPFLTADKFEERVLVLQDMPRGRSKVLTQEEIDKIQCWVDNGYPEN
ncbi:MAG: hypothetical protein IIA45_09140 [Bacteroidetes bacterium]|nr:hypothetical protein [Bacteroidota bacterium]